MSDLEIGSYVEGMELRSVGNSLILRESTLVEAFNLKVIIKLQIKKWITEDVVF